MSCDPRPWTKYCDRCGRILSAKGHDCPALPIIDRFWQKVKIGSPEECWPWQASFYPNGYGQFELHHGKTIGAHVLAFMLTKGDPGRGFVLHHCDNKPCCNPGHLFAGTQQDNMDDMRNKGRSVAGLKRPGTGPKHHPAWISEALKAKIRKASGTQRDIAVRFGVGKSAVSYIRRGEKPWVRPQK
jgi:hypothetical protein